MSEDQTSWQGQEEYINCYIENEPQTYTEKTFEKKKGTGLTRRIKKNI